MSPRFGFLLLVFRQILLTSSKDASAYNNTIHIGYLLQSMDRAGAINVAIEQAQNDGLLRGYNFRYGCFRFCGKIWYKNTNMLQCSTIRFLFSLTAHVCRLSRTRRKLICVQKQNKHIGICLEISFSFRKRAIIAILEFGMSSSCRMWVTEVRDFWIHKHRRQRRRGRDPKYLTCRGRPVLTTPNILTSVLFFPLAEFLNTASRCHFYDTWIFKTHPECTISHHVEMKNS